MRTTKQAGFHSSLAQHPTQHATQPPAEYQEALINLVSSALLIANSSPNLPLLLPPLTNTSVNSTTNPHNLHPMSKPTTIPRPHQPPYPLSPLPSPNYNNNSQSSKKKMRLSTTIVCDDPDPVVTMETTTGRMGITWETNIPAKHAKTKCPATTTAPPATTPWAVA